MILSLQIAYVFHRFLITAFLGENDQAYASIHEISSNYIYSGVAILFFIILWVLKKKESIKAINLIDGINSCLLTLASVLLVIFYPSTVPTPTQNAIFIIIDIMVGAQMGYGMFLFINAVMHEKTAIRKTRVKNASLVASGIISILIFNVLGVNFYYFFMVIMLGIVNLVFGNKEEVIIKENRQVSEYEPGVQQEIVPSRRSFPTFNYFYSILSGLSIWYIAYIFLAGVFEKMNDYNNQEFSLIYIAWIVCILAGYIIHEYSGNRRQKNNALDRLIDVISPILCLSICFLFWLPAITNTNYWQYYLASGLLMIMVGYFIGKAADLLPLQKIWMIVLTIGLFFLITYMAPNSHFLTYFYTPYNYQTLEEQLLGLLEGFIFIPLVLILIWIIRQAAYAISSRKTSGRAH
ncbi:hypothetical protein GF325_07325 [Candidatus Bathyarchaeota archaeon]|nr:hypothetical protein [Candidatus Bathyarchaeota archaeon]